MHFNGLKRITILKAESRHCYRVYSNPCFLATRPDFTYERRLELQLKKKPLWYSREYKGILEKGTTLRSVDERHCMGIKYFCKGKGQGRNSV